jgi:hypothetical protein
MNPLSLLLTERFFFGLAFTALLLLVGHWFPWFRRLSRIQAYAYGVGSLLIGEAIWLVPSNWPLWLGLILFAGVAGAAVCLAYLIDWVQNMLARDLGATDGRNTH